jgi:predicted esterase
MKMNAKPIVQRIYSIGWAFSFRLAIAAIGLLTALPTSSGAADYAQGKIIDRIVASKVPSETYALYLPVAFNPERASPILYVLDPGARGALAAERFRAAAEKYGLIIASSNNSMANIDTDPNVDAMRAMWVDTHLKFRIDAHRIYLAGFSGTAREAIYMVKNLPPGSITGIIGAGAGYPPNVSPSAGDSFLFYGTVGTRDFNFYEMMDLDPKLTAAGITHRIEIFDGTHQWPPEPVAIRAFDWMALQGMKSKNQAKNSALIDGLWREVTQRARSAEATGDLIAAQRLWSDAAADFAGLHDTSEAAAKATSIANDAAFQAEKKRLQGRRDRDKAFLDGINVPLSGNDLKTALSQLRIREYLKEADSGATLDERNSARRILNEIAIQTGFYLPRRYADQGKWDRVVFFLSIAAEVDPKDPSIFYWRAAAYARQHQTEKSIADLRKALAKGYSDLAALEKDADFESIRSERGYLEVIAALKAAGPKPVSAQ